MTRLGIGVAALLGSVVAAGCGSAAPTSSPAPTSTAATAITGSDVPSATSPAAAAAAPMAAPRPVTTATTATTATTTAARVRAVTSSGWSPFARVGQVVLTHPSARVELVGFHESSNDGSRSLQTAPSAIRPVTVESRQRGTGAQTAADIVVEPGTEIRSPVTGRVKRAGRYVLYCKHSDDYVVIEPDGQPGWEVKLLHIVGERVTAGDRVTAGQTVLASSARQLPFVSQVDELRSADPAWPHVHVEVVDPSIPDRPSPGGGCT